MFVYSEGKVTTNSVKEILVPPENMKRLEQNVWQLLLEYLDNSNQAGTVLNHARCIIILMINHKCWLCSINWMDKIHF